MGSFGSTVETVAHLILGLARVLMLSSSSSSSWSNTKRGFGRTAAPIYTFLHALSAISRSVSSSNALLSSSMVQMMANVMGDRKSLLKLPFIYFTNNKVLSIDI